MNALEKMLVKYRADRDKLNFLIDAIESEILASGISSTKRGPRRKGAGSIVTLAAKALENKIAGMTIQALIAELRKFGYESASQDPANTVNAVLHRNKMVFRRFPDGRWILQKYVVKDASEDDSNAAPDGAFARILKGQQKAG